MSTSVPQLQRSHRADSILFLVRESHTCLNAKTFRFRAPGSGEDDPSSARGGWQAKRNRARGRGPHWRAACLCEKVPRPLSGGRGNTPGPSASWHRKGCPASYRTFSAVGIDKARLCGTGVCPLEPLASTRRCPLGFWISGLGDTAPGDIPIGSQLLPSVTPGPDTPSLGWNSSDSVTDKL